MDIKQKLDNNMIEPNQIDKFKLLDELQTKIIRLIDEGYTVDDINPYRAQVDALMKGLYTFK